MAPIIPALLVIVILILPVMGVLVYLGLRSVKADGVIKILGITSVVIAAIPIAVIGFVVYIFVNHENETRKQFIGTYQSVGINDSAQIKLTITSSHFSITPNSTTECIEGSWEPILADRGYLIQFDCPAGKHLSQYYLKDNELIPNSGDLIFIKSKPEESE